MEVITQKITDLSQLQKQNLVRPLLKWAGGKRQLLPEILKKIPESYNTYFEPFFGGGALLFELKPIKAVICDVNEELINVYRVVKDSPDELIKTLSLFKNTEDEYYRIRQLDREKDYGEMNSIFKAARLIYLNKTCFNGLFRVNRNGYFNVPFGNYKDPTIADSRNILEMSRYLNSNEIQLFSTDFNNVLEFTNFGDFVYLDPPYDPLSDASSFTNYTQNKFGRQEQVRLSDVCHTLDSKGVKFILSNSSTEFIRSLYSDFKIDTIYAKRNINSVGTKRGKIEELLVRNF